MVPGKTGLYSWIRGVCVVNVDNITVGLHGVVQFLKVQHDGPNIVVESDCFGSAKSPATFELNQLVVDGSPIVRCEIDRRPCRVAAVGQAIAIPPRQRQFVIRGDGRLGRTGLHGRIARLAVRGAGRFAVVRLGCFAVGFLRVDVRAAALVFGLVLGIGVRWLDHG